MSLDTENNLKKQNELGYVLDFNFSKENKYP